VARIAAQRQDEDTQREDIMTRPRSLLEMAGAPMAPSAWERAALLLIDCQNEYAGGALTLPGVDAAIAAARGLLDRARAAGTPVVHVVHHGRPGGLFDPAAPAGAIVSALVPQGSESVVPKSLPNSFAKTELDATLKRLGRPELIVGGFMTHMCVSATVRAALDHGYRTTVVAAACGTRDLPDPLGGVQPADAVHRATLAALADRFAVVVSDIASWA
jgi:nicotinamidase-related amidase